MISSFASLHLEMYINFRFLFFILQVSSFRHSGLVTFEQKQGIPRMDESGVVPFSQLTDYTCNHPFYKYQCPLCGKQFQRTSRFKEHYMTHSGEKPYACPHCPYKTCHNCNLKTHIRKNHPNASLDDGY